ncbi:hypothetical protein A2276_02675 [candidate division WOR-1 bacterium RIFOXYA12_FULL_43_27]|uniref:TIGR04255 family protein n=1 Tax=candidate division WOR-1 bacterium RIFOXYC2_FULL_46_14 TaxID=1802587 RepID=A0A1F4U7P2_UNCSA|nr:MAG: hypothetical protein A2276_02675 [candidate division WOR-1 bacterium RIFOXYA12_FULL_43_27]OGC19385.1 MAG: hypothetical protein A2292_01655 [candidate division WOR-1 bacterium RIFOXYB2_FULL_46_45]OGC30374.1 MAG: hypothetical protein A2232_01655 [candidate division WOR-1 bacterium RIFOXYA2_FULL_46_56]OGC40974.1 MAG: hypothetical protein A2438_01655 [candidate division WOR-1 bacterium RIFOXYC2_FULL_46_14]
MIYLNEHIMEIRYKPNPRIIDLRGQWAEEISAHMKMSEWAIVENRVDIFRKDNHDRVFVGFRGMGFICHRSDSKSYFPDHAIRFLKFIFSLDGFEKNPLIDRIGVRSKFCIEYEKNFEELRDLYASKYIVLSDRAKKIINAKLVDLAGPWNFADDLGNFNTQSGPMVKTQIAQFFNDEIVTQLPDVGLFFDIDYSVKPRKSMREDEVVKLVGGFAERAWKRNEDFKKIVLEG